MTRIESCMSSISLIQCGADFPRLVSPAGDKFDTLIINENIYNKKNKKYIYALIFSFLYY